MSLDKAFCSMQEKAWNIFGPLSQLWDILEGQKDASHEQISQTEDDIPEDVEEMFTTAKDCCRIIDISITVVGQVFNSLFYFKHRNALMGIMGDKKKVKNMMWEDKDIIQENTSKRLFGEKFDEKITEHVSQKEVQGAFQSHWQQIAK